MSSRSVVIDGVLYVSALDAARSTNLTRPLVSDLARAGLVAARLVCQWFVEPASLQTFMLDQKRQARSADNRHLGGTTNGAA
jgi:hypothetical protein